MIHTIVRNRLLILLLLPLLAIPMGYNIRYLSRDAGVSSLISENHPDYLYSNFIEETFGATDQVVIGVYSEKGIFSVDAIRLINELTLFFENQEGIDEEDVFSITSVNDMRGKDGDLIIEPLIEEDEYDNLTPDTVRMMRNKVRANPLFIGKLVSQDEKSAVVLAGVPSEIGLEEASITALKDDILKKLNNLHKKYPDIRLDFSGPAILKAYISEYMLKDLYRLFPLAIVVVAIIILFILRSVFGMLVPILVTLFAIIWTFGLKGFLDSPITIVETSIPVVLIAIGCADGIHIINEFLFFYRQGNQVNCSVYRTMDLLTLPVILTSLTTGLGFISLISAPGISIRNMGIFLSFGVFVAMIYSLVFIPAMLLFYRAKQIEKPLSTEKSSPQKNPKNLVGFEAFAEKMGFWVIRNKKLITIGIICTLFLSVFSILNIQVESDEVRYLKKDNEFRLATENIERDLGGITSLDIIIEGKEKDLLKQPGILKAIEGLQRFCEQNKLVSYSLSIVDLIKRINFVLHDNDKSYYRLPNQTETLHYTDRVKISGKETMVEKTETISGFAQNAQFLLLYDMSGGEAIDQYVDGEYKTGRITVRLKDMSSQMLKMALKEIRLYVASHFPDTVNVRYANHYIRVVMMDLIIDSQIFSLLTVLTTITILMSIIFRSPVIGLIMAMPVFIAVLLNFTLMWLFNITLNIGTSIIASIGMGVGIDYTIHYFSRFKLLYKDSSSYDLALSKAIKETSRPILSNASAVGIGFAVLLFSEYGVMANIGWITAVTMYTTAFGSLILLPALLAIIRPKITK